MCVSDLSAQRQALLAEHLCLIEVTLGKGGGARLARPASRLTLADIYRATERRPPVQLHRCAPDKRCVIGISGQPERIAHLRRYLQVARTLAAEIVAEGVETADDLAVLRDLGVEYAQGFYWGRPA